MLKSHSHTLTLSHSHTLISLSHLTLSLTLDMLNNFCFHVYAEKSLSHYHTLSLSHSHTLTLSHSFSLIHSLSTCWTTFVFMSMLKSHSLTLSLSHSLTLTLSHSHTLSVSHSWHAEQLLFSCLCSKVAVYRWKCPWVFSWEPALWTLM